MSSIVAEWVPINEMSFSLGIITAGMQLSTVISDVMGAHLCLTDFLGGWPSIFYVSAFLGIVWCAVWPIFVRSKPQDSPLISIRERLFISHHLKEMKKKPDRIPYKAIALSPAVWAMNYANFAGTLGNYTVSMYMPLFFQEVLGISISQNGLFSALPLLTQYFGILIQCFIADKLKSMTNLDHSLISKIFNSIACFGEGGLLILVGYVTLSSSWAVVGLICLATTLSAGFTPGWWTSIQTVAPPFSGTLQSLSSFFSIVGSIITPYIASGLTPKGTKSEWEIVFLIVGIFLISAGIIYNIFGRASPEKWAYEEETDSKIAVVENIN
jgi:ACS family sodium-dependent inorganic phosphate cotransporter-like MFS transporter 5